MSVQPIAQNPIEIKETPIGDENRKNPITITETEHCIEIKETPIGDENLPVRVYFRNNSIEIKETPIGDENNAPDFTDHRSFPALKLKRPR